MAPRALSLLLAPDDEGPITLDQKQRREILRRLERIEHLERENQELRRRIEQDGREIAEQQRQIEERQRELGEQKRELERLKRHLASLKVATPPSKQIDRPSMPAPAEPRLKCRRPGGQPGHAPHGRGRPSHVDETYDLTLGQCPDCGQKLGGPSDTYERFVTELVPAYLFVLRILVRRYWCSRCRHFVQGTTDRALPGRQFGPRLTSTLVLLSMMGLPVRRIQEVVAAMVGLEVSVGEIQDLLEFSARQLGPDYEAIRREVRSSHVVQPDETSMRVGGANWWAWSFATERAAYYELDPSRGRGVVERVLGPHFAGTIVSDGWCAYNGHEGKRQACWIHINRHLQAVEVAHGIVPRGPRDPSLPVFTRAGHPPTAFLRFAERVRTTVREAVEWSGTAPAAAVEERRAKARTFERRTQYVCDPVSSDDDVARISRDLLMRMPYLFEFVRDASVPWHNNAGERAIRPVCVKRKVSGGLRSGVGARTYAKLRSVHETTKRRGWDFLGIVMEALTRGPPAQPSRSASTG